MASLFDLGLSIALLTHSCVILLFRGGKFGRGEGTSIKRDAGDAEDENGEEKTESEEEEDQEEMFEPYWERVIFFFWRGEIKLVGESAERPDLEEPARNNELPFLANVFRDILGVASFASSCTSTSTTSTTFTKSRGSGCHSRENTESVTQDDE